MNHQTPGRQTKQSNMFSLPHQDDCKTRMDTKKCTAKHRAITDSENWSNKQQRNHCLSTGSSLSHWGLNAFYWHQIIALDYAVVEAQKC